jgi:hypothetical protein
MPDDAGGVASFKTAATKVLAETDRPMTAHEIVKVALEQGLISTSGRTPVATMTARLYEDVARNPNTVFRKVETPGQKRAKRGSVQWTLKESAQGGGASG